MKNYAKKTYLGIMKIIYRTNNPIFKMSYSKQKEYLNNYKNSLETYVDYSYAQYLSQMKLKSSFERILLNLLSPIYLAFVLLRVKKKYKLRLSKENILFVNANEGMKDLLPKSLILDKKIVFNTKNNINKMILTDIAEEIFISIRKKYILKPYFLLKNLLKLIEYSNILYRNCPRIIAVFSEYSFTSSILTFFCEKNSIEHVNIMHGEKIFSIRDSFFSFHKMYVWDYYYIELFTELKVNVKNYIVELPEKLIQVKSTNLSIIKIDYKYYLAAENQKHLKRIKYYLDKLVAMGFKVSIRYHPIYSNLKEIFSVFNDYCIESPYDITIYDSILETRNIISLYSSVLFQASLLNKNVIIDDLSDKNKYFLLRDLRYIMFKKKYTLLSEIFKI